MTRTADTRLVALEHAERARQQARFAAMSDAELAAEAAKIPPEVAAWVASLTDDELAAEAQRLGLS